NGDDARDVCGRQFSETQGASGLLRLRYGFQPLRERGRRIQAASLNPWTIIRKRGKPVRLISAAAAYGYETYLSFAGRPPDCTLRWAASMNSNISSVTSLGTGGRPVWKNWTIR